MYARMHVPIINSLQRHLSHFIFLKIALHNQFNYNTYICNKQYELNDIIKFIFSK